MQRFVLIFLIFLNNSLATGKQESRTKRKEFNNNNIIIIAYFKCQDLYNIQ